MELGFVFFQNSHMFSFFSANVPYLWRLWNQFNNPFKELFGLVLWIFKEGGVKNARQCVSLVLREVWSVVWARFGGKVFHLSSCPRGIKVFCGSEYGVRGEWGMPVGVELPFIQIGWVDRDVHHNRGGLALLHVVDPCHWEWPLFPNAQTCLKDFNVKQGKLFVFSDAVWIKEKLSPYRSSFESKTHSMGPLKSFKKYEFASLTSTILTWKKFPATTSRLYLSASSL